MGVTINSVNKWNPEKLREREKKEEGKPKGKI